MTIWRCQVSVCCTRTMKEDARQALQCYGSDPVASSGPLVQHNNRRLKSKKLLILELYKTPTMQNLAGHASLKISSASLGS